MSQRATGVQLNRVVINGEAHRLPSAAAGHRRRRGQAGLRRPGPHRYHLQEPREAPDRSRHRQAHGCGPAVTTLARPQKFFNADCLRATQTRDFKTGRGGPYAIYSGARYGGNINAGPPNLPPCGYDAPQVEKAYGLTSLYKEKLDGTGQTVVIVDAYGSDTITSDANTFSQINGLPALTPGSNFNIYYPARPHELRG